VIEISTTDKKENINPNLPAWNHENQKEKAGGLLTNVSNTPANCKNLQSDDSTNLDTGSSTKKAAPIDNFFSSFNISFD
jgi:hypothetical protein